MIITVTLNAAIDKTLAVPNFRLGRRHRATEQRTVAGGKGVNVARALKTLGQPVIATLNLRCPGPFSVSSENFNVTRYSEGHASACPSAQ